MTRRGWIGAAVALVLTACGTADGRDAKPWTGTLPLAQVAPGFWDQWGDGRAEVDTYALTTPRYGQLRTGSAILVFVTEDFTDGQRVKSDGGHGDEYPVLKLNDTRHFQTGIYDYKVMTSTFTRIDGKATLGLPVKASLSMQEWCGHVWEQVEPREGRLRWVGHSYFDGEGDHDTTLALPPDAVMQDGLPVVARGLAGAVPGADPVRVTVLESLEHKRYAHRPLDWVGGELRRGGTATVEVPAGRFDVTEVVLARDDGYVQTWQIENAAPNRVVRWTTSEGEVAALVATERVAYWQLNHPGDESHLADLGLPTAEPPHMAPTEPTP